MENCIEFNLLFNPTRIETIETINDSENLNFILKTDKKEKQEPEIPEKNGAYFVYMLISCDQKRTYIGCTNDLRRRLRQHNGEIVGGARATMSSRPWSFFGYCYSTCLTSPLNRSQACRLETHWKRASFAVSNSNSNTDSNLNNIENSGMGKKSVKKKRGGKRKYSVYSKYCNIESCHDKFLFLHESIPKRIQNRLLGIQKACNFLSYTFQIK